MHKNSTKCNETLYKWCKNKHGASKIIDTFETYHCFMQFSPIHEFGKFQWQALNFAALHVADAEERIDSGRRRRRSIRGRSTWTWRSRGHLGFILASDRTAGASFPQAEDDATAAAAAVLFLLP
jgi:hypothetical protein